MSAYKRLVCEAITDQKVLVEALSKLGFNPEVNESVVALETFSGETTARTAQIKIPRGQVKARFGGAPNDIGFSLENGKWNMVISDYDTGRNIHKKIEQAYACVALEKALKSSRFQVDLDLSSLGANVGRDIVITGKKVI